MELLTPSLFQNFFQNSPIACCVISNNPEHTLLVANDSLIRNVAMTREQMIGKPLFEVFPGNPSDPQDTSVEDLRQSIAAAIASGQTQAMPVQRYPIPKTLPSGEVVIEERFWSAANTPIHNPDGSVVCIYHTTIEITDQIRAEREQAQTGAALAESENRYRTLVQHLPGGAAFVFDLELRYLMAAGDGLARAGLAPKDFLGRTVFDALDAKALLLYEPSLRRALTGEAFELEHQINDLYFVSRGTPLRDPSGAVTGVIVASFDVTERRRAAQDLQVAKNQLEGVLAAGEIGSWVWDLGDHLVIHDSNFARLWGWDLEPRSAAEHFARIHPDDVSKVEAAVQAAMVSGHLYVREYRIVLDDGSVRWLGGRGKVQKAADGEPVRVTGLVIDIGDLKALEQSLIAADRRKDEFLAMLAHELRNPLAPIRSAAEILSMGRLDATGIAKISGVISRQVTHMTGLVDDLLDVSRVTRGQVDLDEKILNAQQLITAAIEQVRPAIEGKQHHLVVHTPPSPAHVRGDEKRLVQVLVNLLGNAAKYTNSGGTIVLRLEAKDDLVVISVADNGIGMTQETQAVAFELFAQAERKAARSEGGLGIGLALVKSLVKLHKGSVTAHSAGLDKGSEFSVVLPRVSAMTALDTAANPRSARTSAHSLEVMVVDDNHDAGAMLALLVETLGHNVVFKPDAAAALTHADSQSPDVCLLDIGLPGMDGYELARELRRRKGMGDSVLVAVTGYGQDADRQASTAAGFAHHLVKPVDTQSLSAILDAAVGQKAGS